MGDFVNAVWYLLKKNKISKPSVKNEDEEMGHGVGGGPTILNGPGHEAGRVSRDLIHDDDKLGHFRLLVGISTNLHLAFNLHTGRSNRPADNMGIYKRVVHAEKEAEARYKAYSTIINACYFFQIVVAAALTAMGAAGADHGAITAFGAINTIIAGFLTFLKGSGLPNCYQYYGSEWKKLREHIEQRERDFTRKGCERDVFEEVRMIEDRYNRTKHDIENNTPDRYSSITKGTNGDAHHETTTKIDSIASKLSGLHNVVHNLTTHIEKKGHDAADHLHRHGDLLHRHGDLLHRQGRDLGKEMHVASREMAEGAERRTRDVGELARRNVEDLRSAHESVNDHLDRVRDSVRSATEELRLEAAEKIKKTDEDPETSKK